MNKAMRLDIVCVFDFMYTWCIVHAVCVGAVGQRRSLVSCVLCGECCVFV